MKHSIVDQLLRGSTRSRVLSLTVALSAAVMFAPMSAKDAVAATLSIVNGTDGVLPGSFNPVGWSVLDPIQVGSPIHIFNKDNAAGGGLFVSPQIVDISFTFLGKEAGYTNAAESNFIWNDSQVLFNNKATPGEPTTVTRHFDVGGSPGLVPFLFRTITGGNHDAINGTSIYGTLGLPFPTFSSRKSVGSSSAPSTPSSAMEPGIMITTIWSSGFRFPQFRSRLPWFCSAVVC